MKAKNLRQMDILLPQSNSYFGVLRFVERKSDGLAPGTFLRAVRQTLSRRFFGLSCAVINRRSGMSAARPEFLYAVAHCRRWIPRGWYGSLKTMI